MAMVGPARPLTEQFYPTSQQIIPRQELTKIRLKFLGLRAVESLIKLIIVRVLVMIMKMRTVSAVMFIIP